MVSVEGMNDMYDPIFFKKANKLPVSITQNKEPHQTISG